MSLTLLDWRRTVAGLYAVVRAGAEADPEGSLTAFRIAAILEDLGDRLGAIYQVEGRRARGDRSGHRQVRPWPSRMRRRSDEADITERATGSRQQTRLSGEPRAPAAGMDLDPAP